MELQLENNPAEQQASYVEGTTAEADVGLEDIDVLECRLSEFESIKANDDAFECEEREVIDADEAVKEDSKRKRKCVVISGLVLLGLCVIAVVIGLSVGLTDRNTNDTTTIAFSQEEITPAPTPASTPEECAFLFDRLRVFSTEEELSDPSTPQGRALLQLCDEVQDGTTDDRRGIRLDERYGLMLLYFSTEDDPAWNEDGYNAGWENFGQNQCGWDGVVCDNDNSDHGQLVISELQLDDLDVSNIPVEVEETLAYLECECCSSC